ncbi:MAG: peptidylprolyl isomerase [Treponema sp.]|jgi:FKBP-type peptidyl-prolyl cis-trans isomerase SlyD|nr:peptidylprolyl isomerase [Treponema sp.]
MTVKKDYIISVDYTLTDDKNNILDSSIGEKPLEYLHGHGNIIPGLENAMEGKSEGDKFTVRVPAASAYGERDINLLTEIPLENFKEAGKIEPGMRFQTRTSEGARLITVVKIENDKVTIDGNHPLAGTDLNFDVTVTAIREAGENELHHGRTHSRCDDCCDRCDSDHGCCQ